MQTNQAATESAQKLERFESYLASDPGNPDLLANVIDLHLDLGQIEHAYRHAHAATQLYPHDLFFRHRFGNVLLAQGKLDEAELLFSTLLAEVPDPSIATNLALIYFRQKKFSDAHAVLLPYVEMPEASCEYVTLLMRTLHHLSDLKKAIELVEQHAPRFVDKSDFLSAASLLYLDDGQLEQANKFSAAAMANGAQPMEALVVGGTIALGEGDVAVANARFDAALVLNPNDGRTWSGLGLTSLLNRDLIGAADQLQRATDHMPTHIGTWHALGWCKIFSQDLQGAEAVFLKALDLDRNFAESHGGLAVVAALQGNRSAAEESIKIALRLDPKSLSAKYAQLALSGGLNDPDKFKAIASRLLSARQSPFGGTMADMVAKFMPK